MKTSVINVIPDILLKEFSAILTDKMGLYFPEERWRELEKKMLPVVFAFGFEDPVSCIQWLISNALNREQIEVLAYYLTIGETYFFRDTRMFEILGKYVIPELIQRHKQDQSLRIWSAGCCTGEEPYTLAIILHHQFPELRNWSIFILGSDINLDFLRRAELACYKKWSFRTTPPEIVSKYFNLNGEGTYELISDIKRMVKFIGLNLAENTYPDSNNGTNQMDLILCHNVLIYFSQEQIARTIHRLAGALATDGLLSFTAIETPFVKSDNLNSFHYAEKIFFKKKRKQKIKLDNLFDAEETQAEDKKDEILLKTVLPVFFKIPESQETAHKPKIKLEPASPIIKEEPLQKKDRENVSLTIFEECTQLYRQMKYKEVIAKLLKFLMQHKKNSVEFKQSQKEIHLLIRTYANQGDLSKALEWCEEALQIDKLDPELHYIHATIQSNSGNIAGAVKSLKSCLFLDADFVAAHFMLGLLEKQQGNPKAAALHHRTALELLENYRSDEILNGTEELTAGRLKDILKEPFPL